MKLNKTETKLIEQAKRNRNALFGTHSGFSSGGKSKFGDRDHNGAVSLVDKGLAVFIKSYSSYDKVSKFTTVYSWERTYQLTEAGKKIEI